MHFGILQKEQHHFIVLTPSDTQKRFLKSRLTNGFFEIIVQSSKCPRCRMVHCKFTNSLSHMFIFNPVTKEEGLRRMARRNTAGDERLVDKASNILMFLFVYYIHHLTMTTIFTNDNGSRPSNQCCESIDPIGAQIPIMLMYTI